jgi:hypothetical protein
VTRKYLSFDIETAKILPGFVDDLMAERPLGISCAAALAEDELMPQLFHSVDGNGRPALQMSQADVSKLVDFLVKRTAAGYTIVTTAWASTLTYLPRSQAGWRTAKSWRSTTST